MRDAKGGTSLKSILSILSIALFLTAAQGHAMSAFAEDWNLWPKGRGETPAPAKPAEGEKPKGAVPAAETATREAAAAGKAGGEAGKTVAAGVSAGSLGKVAAIAAGLLAIGIAAIGNSTTSAHH